MIHVAMIWRRYLEAILDGSKTIESRLTITARAPYQRIALGERIYFKISAGPFRARARAARITFLEGLTPARVAALRAEFGSAIQGDDDYWRFKRTARYATLIWLADVEPVVVGPRIQPQRGLAWLTLADRMDVSGARSRAPRSFRPINADAPLEITLTAGNIRNHHVYIPRDRLSFFPADSIGGSRKSEAGQQIEIAATSGIVIRTDIVGHRAMFRSRQWGGWFTLTGAQPGDRVRLRRVAPTKYRASLVHAPA